MHLEEVSRAVGGDHGPVAQESIGVVCWHARLGQPASVFGDLGRSEVRQTEKSTPIII